MNFKTLVLKTVIIAILFAVIILGCKKTDSNLKNPAENQASVEAKFFNKNRTGNSEENALINFLQRKNNKEHFVAKTVAQIGYPRWDKMLKKPNKKTLVVGDAAVMGTGGGITADDVYYIPFVRDSQNYVNAAMVIRTNATDTTLSYKCDWQYKQKQNDVNSLNDAAENFAVFFMVLDNNVFGHTKFKIIDTSIFRNNSRNPREIKLNKHSNNTTSQTLAMVTYCQDVTIAFTNCYNPGHCKGLNGSCDNCAEYCTGYLDYTYCWDEWEWDDFVGGGGGGGGIGGDGSGSGGGGGSVPPNPCGVEQPNNTNGATANPGTMVTFKAPCGGDSPGWEPIIDNDVDIIIPPDAPEYHDISEFEPPVSLQSLFNCFAQIPDAGAIYTVKLCVDLPVNGFWQAPFNVIASPGHTFLTLTKTNGSQTISQSVGFYPIGSGGNPINPNATGAFKDNGYPAHEYNAAITDYSVSANQFSMVMNNLLSHENDTYNIYVNNCTTVALDAFNLLLTQPITIEPFVVKMGGIPYTFVESPQKLYKRIGELQPGSGLGKDFNVNYKSPLSTKICP
ncbi:MAG: hypothetical protein JST29_04750 [Bacteroidetes bacterium]|nr:hypothetical protein [Bacteroidota bacterium]